MGDGASRPLQSFFPQPKVAVQILGSDNRFEQPPLA